MVICEFILTCNIKTEGSLYEIEYEILGESIAIDAPPTKYRATPYGTIDMSPFGLISQ
jgi:hypothetical protein